jgi:hypothetical protein
VEKYRSQSEVASAKEGEAQKLLLEQRHEACSEKAIVLKPGLAESQKFNAELTSKHSTLPAGTNIGCAAVRATSLPKVV